jgi:hypothetical protein
MRCVESSGESKAGIGMVGVVFRGQVGQGVGGPFGKPAFCVASVRLADCMVPAISAHVDSHSHIR